MNNPVVYDYKGSQISFISGENVMVNATQMAKPFGKFTKDWLTNKSTKEFLSTLSTVRTIPLTGLVEVKQGGNGEQGTWMHEDVALEFARWLSPAFAIWCNDRIKELLRTGVATQEKAMLEQQNNYLSNEIRQQAPKVKYVDDVLQSARTYTSTQMAKELDMKTAEQLHKKLKEMGVMFYQSGQWMLTATHCGKGYTRPRTTAFTRSDGSQGTNTITTWTETGRLFLHQLFEALQEVQP